LRIVSVVIILFTALCFADINGDIIAGYLDQMGEDVTYHREGNEFMLVTVNEDSLVIPYLYILVDPPQEGCLLAALTPGIVPESGADRTAALETLAELNWNNTWAKFVSDPETGEVSAMYTFSTEDGLGSEAFSVIINVLLGTVEENWDTLLSL
jgi:hypothetical protein